MLERRRSRVLVFDLCVCRGATSAKESARSNEARDGARGDEDEGWAAVIRSALGSPPRSSLLGDGALRGVGNSDPPNVWASQKERKKRDRERVERAVVDEETHSDCSDSRGEGGV